MCSSKLVGLNYFSMGLKREARLSGRVFSIVDFAKDTIGHETFVSSVAVGNFINGVSYFGYGEGMTKGVGVAPNV